jgi:hypothetical protein
MKVKEPPPQPKSHLFRLGRGPEYFTTNACLNYMDTSVTYIRAYQQAADTLIDHIEATGNHQDTLVLPIIYLFRHYLELLLKSIITKMRDVLDLKAPTDNDLMTHDLGDLWNWAKPLIADLGDDPASIRDEIKDGNSVFAEFQRFDKKAETFRFAGSRTGKPHLPEFRLINIRIFRDECSRIAEFLEGVLGAAESAWQYVAEQHSEMRAE